MQHRVGWIQTDFSRLRGITYPGSSRLIAFGYGGAGFTEQLGLITSIPDQ